MKITIDPVRNGYAVYVGKDWTNETYVFSSWADAIKFVDGQSLAFAPEVKDEED